MEEEKCWAVETRIPEKSGMGGTGWGEEFRAHSEEMCQVWIMEHEEEARKNYKRWEYRIVHYLDV